MNRSVTLLACVGLVLVVTVVVTSEVTATSAPTPQITAVAPNQATVGQTFKNLQVLMDLKDHPANDLWSSMQFIAASLGVKCDYCHETQSGPFDTDGKPTKKTARNMIRMVRSINETTFGGGQVVTCATCHKGSPHPSGVPTLWYKTPEELAVLAAALKSPAPAASDATLPTVDQIFAAYRKAVGVADLKSLRMSGVNEVALGATVPFTFEAVLPDKANLGTQGGAVHQVMNGDQVFRVPVQPGNIQAAPAAVVKKTLIDPFMPVKYEVAQAPRRVTGVETLNGRRYYVVESQVAGVVERLFFDADTHLLYKIRNETPTPLGVRLDERVYEDYRNVNGVMLSFLVSTHYVDQQAVFRVSEIQTNVTIDPKSFDQPAAAERKAIAVDPAILDSYVGTYQVQPQLSLAVTRDGDHLVMTFGAGPKVALAAETPTGFFAKAPDVYLLFVKDPTGKVIGAQLSQPPAQYVMVRVK